MLEEEICTFIPPSEPTFQDVLGKDNTLRKIKQCLGRVSAACTALRVDERHRIPSIMELQGSWDVRGLLEEKQWELAECWLWRVHRATCGTLWDTITHRGTSWDTVTHCGTL